MSNVQKITHRRFDPPAPVLSGSAAVEEKQRAPRRFQFEHKRGYACVVVRGWGIRYKDTRRRLPDYDERIGTVKSLKLGPLWFSIVRPRDRRKH